jgi:hypothetical protein
MDEFQELPIEAPSEPSVADKSKDHAVDNIEEDTLDPYAEIQQGNLFPLIAGIKHIDLNYMLDENTPLLHHICICHWISCLKVDPLNTPRTRKAKRLYISQ